MIVWMLWATLFATGVAAAAHALERVAQHLRWPRRFIWVAALSLAAIAPALLAVRTRRTSLPRPEPRALTERRATAKTAPPAATPPSITLTVERAAVQVASPDRWAVIVWTLMSLGVLGVFAQSARSLARRRATWREAALADQRAFVAPDAGPAVVGFTRPRIVLPEWALALDDTVQSMMVRHEREHIRAGDPVVVLVAGVTLVALPWNAALWWIVRRLRLAMELDCDTRVIRAVGNAHQYGAMLLAVGERHTASLPFAASLAGPRPFLERRITAMTALRPRRPLLASLPFALAGGVIMTAAAWAPHPSSLASIARTRLFQPYPSVAEVKAMVAANVPTLESDSSDYVVIVLDSNNVFVKAIPGRGSCMIRVAGDTRTVADRRAETAARMGRDPSLRLGSAGGSAAGMGGGRGGRGGGGAGSTGGAAVAPSTSPSSGRTDYMQGVISSMTDPVTGGHKATPMNAAPGLNSAKDDLSGIDGIPAVRVTSIENYMFGQDNPLATSRMVRVVVVTTK